MKKVKDVKKSTEKLKKALEKIHALDDDADVSDVDLEELERALDASLHSRGRYTC
jgi:hypothetical protein